MKIFHNMATALPFTGHGTILYYLSNVISDDRYSSNTFTTSDGEEIEGVEYIPSIDVRMYMVKNCDQNSEILRMIIKGDDKKEVSEAIDSLMTIRKDIDSIIDILQERHDSMNEDNEDNEDNENPDNIIPVS